MLRHRRSRLSLVAALGLAASLVVPAVGNPAGADDGAIGASIEVVASGLNNPRGLDLSGAGDLYVAEAGKGGDGPCIRTSAGEDWCLGLTGAITVIEGGDGDQSRLVPRLPSIADPAGGGAAAVGPSDVDFRASKALVTIGLLADPAERPKLGPAGRRMGRVFTLENGDLQALADIAAFEAAENPDAGQPDAPVDTNPNSVYRYRGGGVVADAGGNSLLWVDAHGDVSTLAVFRYRFVKAPEFLGLPPGTKIPMHPVPTSVTQGPDGALYVGELTGFPFPVGRARVYRVEPGEPPTVYARGFTHISDVEFDDEGNLYVLQLGTNSLLGDLGPGKLIRVSKSGGRTEIAPGELTFPMGLEVVDSDEFYVSNNGASPGGGQVLHIELD
jgi:hypothetical protein